MAARLVERVAKAYGILLIAAIGGLVGANLSRLFGAFLAAGDRAEQLVHWVHGGWIVGAVLFLLGALTKQVRVISSSMFGLSPKKSPIRRQEPSGERTGRSIRGRSIGVPAGIALGAAGGMILGGMLGGTFLMFWFSLTSSPFAPASWASSVQIERSEIASDVPDERPVATTRHPVALYAFFGPMTLGAAAGAIFGGGCAAQGRFTVE